MLKKLEKKMAKLEKKYDEQEGKPILQKRTMKCAESTQRKIDAIMQMYELPEEDEDD